MQVYLKYFYEWEISGVRLHTSIVLISVLLVLYSSALIFLKNGKKWQNNILHQTRRRDVFDTQEM